MSDIITAEQAALPGKIMVWPDSNSKHFGTWSTTRYPERAVPFVPAVQIDQPYEPGSFVGDIWFGHPVKRTMGTHRWDGADWQELPSEMDAVLALLAEARSDLAEAEARGMERAIAILTARRKKHSEQGEGVQFQALDDLRWELRDELTAIRILAPKEPTP